MSENGKPPDNGILCLSEVHEGIVIRVVDDEVEVAYETDSDIVEQVYDRRQFIAQPQENDRVRVVVSMWLRPPEPKDIDAFLTRQEQEEGFPGF
jgi:putative ribosome biogenesis GTPase RsgA